MENWLADERMAPMVRRLRTPGLRKQRESRDAAIFTYLVGRALSVEMFFAREEAADYDFVVRWRANGQLHFCPVQLKELIPADLNPVATLDGLLRGLHGYGGA